MLAQGHIARAVVGSACRSLSNIVFNRDLKRRHREAALKLDGGNYYDYLRQESAANLVDRLEDITRTFPKALELGSYRGELSKHITCRESVREGGGGVGGIKKLIQCDFVAEELNGFEVVDGQVVVEEQGVPGLVTLSKKSFDEENGLPFEDGSFDLVMSSLSMHWVNDLPMLLKRIKNVLKPDGAFVASMFGGNTLRELRYCFYLAEQERRGGLSPHASPLAKASDIAGLLQGAGFTLPTVDIDTVTISYPNAIVLMEHLVHMGEGTASLNRSYAVGTDTFLAMAALYQDMYGLEDGSVTATFEIIYMIGWSPDVSQPKACRRGSAQNSLKDLGKTDIITPK